MADGRVFSAVGGVEETVEEEEGAGAVFGADGVGEFVEAALLGGEDHGFYVAEGDPVFSFYVEEELFEFAGDEHHVGAEGGHRLVPREASGSNFSLRDSAAVVTHLMASFSSTRASSTRPHQSPRVSRIFS